MEKYVKYNEEMRAKDMNTLLNSLKIARRFDLDKISSVNEIDEERLKLISKDIVSRLLAIIESIHEAADERKVELMLNYAARDTVLKNTNYIIDDLEKTDNDSKTSEYLVNALKDSHQAAMDTVSNISDIANDIEMHDIAVDYVSEAIEYFTNILNVKAAIIQYLQSPEEDYYTEEV